MENGDTIIGLAKIIAGIAAGAFALWRFVFKLVVDKIGDAIRDLSSAIRENTNVLNDGKVLAAKAEERDKELRRAIDRTTQEVRAHTDRLENLIEKNGPCKFGEAS